MVGEFRELTANGDFSRTLPTDLSSWNKFIRQVASAVLENDYFMTAFRKTLSLGVIFSSFVLHSLSANEAETEKWTQLLDAKLSKWESWMGVPHTSVKDLPAGTSQSDDYNTGQPLGLGNDPKKVFSVIEEDGKPVLAITGEIYGGLTTLAEYENFHFSCQVKWGEKKWIPRLNVPRDSGFLYHCTGKHGAFWNVWMSCVEYQVQENDFGDLYMLAGPVGDLRMMKPPAGQPNGKPVWDVTQPLSSSGGASKAGLFESPHGQWTTVEVYAIGEKSVHLVNGHVVLAIENIRSKDGSPLSKGKFQIQSEGAEVFYRDIKIRPAAEFPAEISKAAGFQK